MKKDCWKLGDSSVLPCSSHRWLLPFRSPRRPERNGLRGARSPQFDRLRQKALSCAESRVLAAVNCSHYPRGGIRYAAAGSIGSTLPLSESLSPSSSRGLQIHLARLVRTDRVRRPLCALSGYNGFPRPVIGLDDSGHRALVEALWIPLSIGARLNSRGQFRLTRLTGSHGL